MTNEEVKKIKLEHLKREAYLLARSDYIIEGDHPKGVDVLEPTFNMIDSMIDMAYWRGQEDALKNQGKVPDPGVLTPKGLQGATHE